MTAQLRSISQPGLPFRDHAKPRACEGAHIVLTVFCIADNFEPEGLRPVPFISNALPNAIQYLDSAMHCNVD